MHCDKISTQQDYHLTSLPFIVCSSLWCLSKYWQLFSASELDTGLQCDTMYSSKRQSGESKQNST
jgi:hypothetical protein